MIKQSNLGKSLIVLYAINPSANNLIKTHNNPLNIPQWLVIVKIYLKAIK